MMLKCLVIDFYLFEFFKIIWGKDGILGGVRLNLTLDPPRAVWLRIGHDQPSSLSVAAASGLTLRLAT